MQCHSCRHHSTLSSIISNGWHHCVIRSGHCPLRLPRLKPGGSDPLPLSCFRLRDRRFTVRGHLRWPIHRQSQAEACSGGTAAVTTAASLSAARGVCAGPRPQRVVPLACVGGGEHHVQDTLVLLPAGAIDRGTPKHDSVGKVLQEYSCTGGRNRQAERAIHPLAQAAGLSGPLSVTDNHKLAKGK
jgi:hypothetical protein